MIDPLVSLALALHSNKGVYALLLGSGISRAAGIPTGWDVVLDLIRKVAAVERANCEPEPDVWYRKRFDREPDYAELLAFLAKAPAERQTLLRGYFEPNDQEREEGSKMPSRAHHAIAQLIKRGVIKVVVTTNFDRLLERALDAVAIVPTVISSPDQFLGAMPLQHSDCTIIKVHGDYLDTRIRNTADELASYDPALNAMLDRVFSEYGLIICGWSGEWDTALRAAIERCAVYRFTCYWADVRKLGDQASALAHRRQAQVLRIDGADQFFSALIERLDALDDLAASHPLSPTLLAATAKRYLAEDRFRIKLHDLVLGEVNRVATFLSSDSFKVSEPAPDEKSVQHRAAQYEAIAFELVPLFSVGAYWGSRQHDYLWTTGIQRLAHQKMQDGQFYPPWVALKRYPALAVLYATGLSAVAAKQYATLHALLSAAIVVDDEERPLPVVLNTYRIAENSVGNWILHSERRYVPISERLHSLLQVPLASVLPERSAYENAFDQFEIFLSMYCGMAKEWFVPGRFAWKSHRGHIPVVDTALALPADDRLDTWPPLKAGMFNGSVDKVRELVADLKKELPTMLRG